MSEKSEAAGGKATVPPNPTSGATSNPGEGIRSMRSSTLFRITNFELYAKPNVVVMGLGLIGLSISVGYMIYMRSKHEAMGLYTAVDKEGKQTLMKRQSRWL